MLIVATNTETKSRRRFEFTITNETVDAWHKLFARKACACVREAPQPILPPELKHLNSWLDIVIPEFDVKDRKLLLKIFTQARWEFEVTLTEYERGLFTPLPRQDWYQLLNSQALSYSWFEFQLFESETAASRVRSLYEKILPPRAPAA